MGRQTGGQGQLLYAFNLEDHIPSNHLLRGINRLLDLSDLRCHSSEFYSHTGRPSIDPELMVRMLVIGYTFGIRSERRLCKGIHINLAYRWFCQLGLEDKSPDHSSFSKNRRGSFRQSEILRHVFETVLRGCMTEGLMGGDLQPLTSCVRSLLCFNSKLVSEQARPRLPFHPQPQGHGCEGWQHQHAKHVANDNDIGLQRTDG